MQAGPILESVKPLCFMIGKWRSVCAEGFFPTIGPFSYCEELNFVSLGQNLLNYTSVSWNPTTKAPIHLEAGFLFIKTGTDTVALVCTNNIGVGSLEEGRVRDNKIHLKSTKLSTMSFYSRGPAVCEMARRYTFDPKNRQLEYKFDMGTDKTPLAPHLLAVYKRCDR